MMHEYIRENKNLVVTSYGHDRIIDKISISLFDCTYDGDQNIDNYCTTINNLELKDNKWVYARLITQNTPYFLHTFIPLQFTDIIMKLDNQALEKVIREKNFDVWAKALKYENEAVQSRILGRMTKRASEMLKEDMECLGQIGYKDAEESKNEILLIIRHLIECGEILSPYKDIANDASEIQENAEEEGLDKF